MSLVQITYLLAMYMVADLCWLYFEPEIVPSRHGLLYFHHLVTLLLLLFPLVHKEFSSFTCLDGGQPPLGADVLSSYVITLCRA